MHRYCTSAGEEIWIYWEECRGSVLVRNSPGVLMFREFANTSWFLGGVLSDSSMKLTFAKFPIRYIESTTTVQHQCKYQRTWEHMLTVTSLVALGAFHLTWLAISLSSGFFIFLFFFVVGLIFQTVFCLLFYIFLIFMEMVAHNMCGYPWAA